MESNPKSRCITNRPAHSLQRSGEEFESHEDVAWEGAFEIASEFCREAEPGVVIGVSDNDDDAFAGVAKEIEAGSDQRRADAALLVGGRNGDRCKGDGRNFGGKHPGEENVAGDFGVDLRHKGDEDGAFIAQAVYEGGFIGLAKGRFIDGVNGVAVGGSLGADEHRFDGSVRRMDEFPGFMRQAANRIAAGDQATPGVEGHVFDGADGS